MRKLALLGALGALLSPIAASAAPGIASLPVGQSVRYHVTTNTSKPPAAGGSSSTDHFILLTRSAPAAFAVVVDGAPSGTNATEVQAGLREHNAQVDFSASIAFDARRVLTNASGSITADVHKGLLRNKTDGDTWSITIVP